MKITELITEWLSAVVPHEWNTTPVTEGQKPRLEMTREAHAEMKEPEAGE